MNQPYQQPQQEPQFIRTAVAPPDYVRYAHALGRGMLTFEQIDELVKAINTAYVQAKQGSSYLSQHQARAEMNRIFGYGNWSADISEMTLEYEERMHKDDVPKHPTFPRNGRADVYWISAYRAKATVEIRDLWGMPVTTYGEYHVEENAPQPNRGEARALAATSVESYALRRCLINLGDRFGLGLYNGGSTLAHGQYTIQQYPGQLFNWAQIGSDGKPVIAAPPVPIITHDTIVAEPVISDDGTNPYWVDPNQQEATAGQQSQQPYVPMDQPMSVSEAAQVQQEAREQARQQAAPQQQQQQQQQQMPQQVMPQFDPTMLARVQGGLKTDQQGGQ